MVRGDVLSGAAFRAVLRSAAAFIVILAVMSVLAIRLIDTAMTREIELGIGEMEKTLTGAFEDEGAAALREQVEDLSRASGAAAFAHALYGQGGRWLAGNVDVSPVPDGWERRETAPLVAADRAPQTYLVHALAVGDWTLVTGSNLKSLHAAQTSALRGLAIAGFFVVLSMLAVGYFLSRASQVKLERMEAALDRVAQGDAGARIGAMDGDDQIDRISRRIDGHLAQIESLMDATRRTAASVAHDLRKPLSRARLSLERALSLAHAGRDSRAELEAAVAQLDALGSIITTILRISRIEAGEAGDTRRVFELDALLDELAETYEGVAEDAGQALVLDVKDRPLPLRGDREMIAQMAVNLLQNAITHAGAGARITLGARRDGEHGVTLWVSDTGVGVPAALYDQVLQPFFRADAARTSDGSGLGLSLAKAIADRHGAKLSFADNAPGLAVRVVFSANV